MPQEWGGSLGRDKVFLDVDSIDYGVNFETTLHETLEKCKVGIVIIGRGFSRETKRIQTRGGSDVLVTEVSSFLHRGIPVIPVLSEGARLPTAASLPEAIRPLLTFQAVEIRHTNFESDISLLLGRVKNLYERSSPS